MKAERTLGTLFSKNLKLIVLVVYRHLVEVNRLLIAGFYFRFIDDEDVISYTRFDNDDYSIKYRGKDYIMLFNLEGDIYEASEIVSEYGISREKLLCNSYHYNSKLLKSQIPYVKTKDIWVTEDVYNTFKENFDK
ncbi:MAG: hypothetical protein ACRCZ0_06645 [Cetobacterium sp.]